MTTVEKPKKKRERDPALDQLIFPDLWKDWTVRDIRRLAEMFREGSVLRSVVLQRAIKVPVTITFSNKEADLLLQVFDVLTWARKRIEKLQSAASWNYMRSKFKVNEP